MYRRCVFGNLGWASRTAVAEYPLGRVALMVSGVLIAFSRARVAVVASAVFIVGIVQCECKCVCCDCLCEKSKKCT